MNVRLNQALVGIILFLLGIFCLLQNNISLDIISVSIFLLGFAFILLYKTKKKSWSLLIGVFLILFGINDTLRDIFINSGQYSTIINSFISAVHLFAPGITLLILFYDKNKNGLLIPGSLLTAFGVYTFLGELFIDYKSFIFNFIMGICFYFIYYNGRYFLGRFFYFLSILFFILSAIRIYALL